MGSPTYEFCCSVPQSYPNLCDLMDCSTPGFPVHHHLPELAQTHVHWVVMPSSHLILCHPLVLLPSIFPSSSVFSNKLALCIKWSKYWSFSFSISPSNVYSGLITFRIDWFDLLVVQGTPVNFEGMQFSPQMWVTTYFAWGEGVPVLQICKLFLSPLNLNSDLSSVDRDPSSTHWDGNWNWQMGGLDANADFLLSVVQAEVLCPRALSWDGGRYLGYDSITAFISQAAFTPQRVVPSQVFACICSHFFLVSTTQHQTSFSSVQFSRSVVSDSLRPHESQHIRPPCPLPTPGVRSDSHPSSQWCHSTISSWVVPFSSCPQSLPASESFPMSQLFAWGGQSTGVSALANQLSLRNEAGGGKMTW